MTNQRKIEYDIVYMNMANCLRPLSFAIRSKVGCLIVSEAGQIISQGYNGMPSGLPNSCEHEVDEQLVTNDEVLHAESNAISKCAKFLSSTDGATCYVTLSPCLQCSKLIIQSGIKRVVYLDEYRDLSGVELLLKCGIKVQQIYPDAKELRNIDETYCKYVKSWNKENR